MLIKVYFNPQRLRELKGGETVHVPNKEVGDFAIETWLDSHEYNLDTAAMDNSNLTYIKVSTKRSEYAPTPVAPNVSAMPQVASPKVVTQASVAK